MDILTRTISLFFQKRMSAIERFATEPDLIQERQLRFLLNKAGETEWGKRYDFKSIRSYPDYRERVPIQSYDDLKPFINRMIRGEKNILWPSTVHWYAKSSGTTSDKSKFLPVTNEILHGCHYQGGYDTVTLYLRDRPDSRFFAGKGLILGGSHSLSPLNRQAHQGDLSAILIQNIPALGGLVRIPGKKIILMDEWESKIKAIVESTWRKDVTNLSGVPSWMLVLLKAILRRAGKEDLSEVWPNLEVFFHGGISFEPYRDQYKSLITSPRMRYMETYNASEGFFGLQDDPDERTLLLMLDYGIFYEFIPMSEIGDPSPRAIPLTEVEVGTNYAMIISTAGGLWRYEIGDTVRFTSTRPYKFVISGRVKHFINAFGEELMVNNADKAIAIACRETGAVIKEYTAAPLFLLDKAKGRHQWFIEFEKMPPSVDEFARSLDEALQSVNSDYEAKRYKEISLQPLEVIVAKPGAFYSWLSGKGKLGGQHKIPRLSNSRQYLEELLEINQSE